jgi:hypothetical protein
MGTRMVTEAQTEIGALISQNSGGPVNVTKIQAAGGPNISDTAERGKVGVPICRIPKIAVQINSNTTIEVE